MSDEPREIVPLEGSVPAEAEAGQELAVRMPDELAAEVARVLDRLAKHLQLENPHPSTARRVRGARTVPRDFVVSMMDVAERRPDLPSLGQFDSAAAREVLESGDAYRLMAERTAIFLASLNYTIEARWAKVVAQAMHQFKMASIVADVNEDADLAAEIKNLQKLLGRKGSRKKKTAKKKSKPQG